MSTHEDPNTLTFNIAGQPPMIVKVSAWHAFMRAVFGMDEADRAQALILWVEDGRLDRYNAGVAAGVVWQKSASPEHLLGTARWVQLFRDGGFQTDGATTPTEPLTIYRGAAEPYKRGMAWTTEPDTAAEFAALHEEEPAYVFTATIPPDGVLAMFGHEDEPSGNRVEFEVVVDPALLQEIEQTDIGLADY